MNRSTVLKRTAIAAAALAPMLTLSACGVDASDPDAVAKGFAEALLMDRDCEKAATFLDEDQQEDFVDSCDGDDIPNDVEFGDDEDFESDTDDDYSEAQLPIKYEDGEEEETFYVYLEKNGNDEWEVVSADGAPTV